MTKMETLVMQKNIAVHAAAIFADEAETKRLCEETQKLWDAGHSFIVDPGNCIATFYRVAGFELRQSDSQEELDAAVDFLETQLAALAIRNTITQMSREECTVLVRALDHLDIVARVQVLGQDLRSCEIRSIWNKQHQEESPILPTAGLAPEI